MAESTQTPSPENPLQGGCLCGGVRYEITAPFSTARYCHCTRCQRRTGTASSANGLVPSSGFRLLSGREAVRSFEPPTGVPKLFCSICGSALFSRAPQDPDRLGIRLGAFDDDPGIRPSLRQFVAYAAPWEPIPDDGLPRHPEGADAQ